MLATLHAERNGTNRRHPEVVRDVLAEFIANAYSSRAALARRFTSSLDPRRNVYKEVGYPEPGEVLVDDYQNLFERDSLAFKVVSFMPLECWRSQPMIYETEDSEESTAFEAAWDELPKCLATVGKPRGRNGKGSAKPPVGREGTPNGKPTPAVRNRLFPPGANGNGKPKTEYTATTAEEYREGTSWFQDEEGSPIWEYLLRADILSGVGRYAAILLGIDDGLPLSQPAKGVEEVYSVADNIDPKDLPGYYGFQVNAAESKGRKLRYLRVFPETLAKIASREKNFTSPRHGQPTSYNVTLDAGEPGGKNVSPRETTESTSAGVTVNIHWSRMVHVCDTGVNYGPSEVFGGERLRTVLNDVLGAQKIGLSDPEMYWLAGLAMTFFSNQTGFDAPPDMTSIKNQIEEMVNGMQRYVVAPGMTASNIGPQPNDPNPNHDLCVKRICIAKGWPKRIFEGSERGELASSQDEREHKDRIRQRIKGYLTPRLIVPFVDRLILLGVLPEPKGYTVDWPDVSTQTDKEQAEAFGAWATAWGTYKEKGVAEVIPPIYAMTRSTQLGNMTEEEAEEMLKAAEEAKAQAEQEAIDKQKQLVDEGLAPDPALAEDQAAIGLASAIGGQGAGGKPPGKGGPPKPGEPKKKPTFNHLPGQHPQDFYANVEYEDYRSGRRFTYNAAKKKTAKLSGGRWVTLDNGVHVYIKSGRIAVGPAALKQKLSGQKEPDAPDTVRRKKTTVKEMDAKHREHIQKAAEADKAGDKATAKRYRFAAYGYSKAAKHVEDGEPDKAEFARGKADEFASGKAKPKPPKGGDDKATPAKPAATKEPAAKKLKPAPDKAKPPGKLTDKDVDEAIERAHAKSGCVVGKGKGKCAEVSVSLWDELGRPEYLTPVGVSLTKGTDTPGSDHVVLLDKKTGEVIDPTGYQYGKPTRTTKDETGWTDWRELPQKEMDASRLSSLQFRRQSGELNKAEFDALAAKLTSGKPPTTNRRRVKVRRTK